MFSHRFSARWCQYYRRLSLSATNSIVDALAKDAWTIGKISTVLYRMTCPKSHGGLETDGRTTSSILTMFLPRLESLLESTSLNPHALQTTLCSLVKLGANNKKALQPELLCSLQAKLCLCVPELLPKHIVPLIQCLATLSSIVNKELFSLLLDVLAEKKYLGSFSNQEMANIVWAVAKMGVSPTDERVVRVITEATRSTRLRSPAQSSANLKYTEHHFTKFLWALGRLNYSDPGPWRALYRALEEEGHILKLTPQATSNIFCALSSTPMLCFHDGLPVLLARRIVDYADKLTPQGVSLCLLASSKLGPILPSLVPALCHQLKYRLSLDEFSPEQLSFILLSLGTMETPVDVELLEKLCSNVSARLRFEYGVMWRFENAGAALANLMWGFARLSRGGGQTIELHEHRVSLIKPLLEEIKLWYLQDPSRVPHGGGGSSDPNSALREGGPSAHKRPNKPEPRLGRWVRGCQIGVALSEPGIFSAEESLSNVRLILNAIRQDSQSHSSRGVYAAVIQGMLAFPLATVELLTEMARDEFTFGQRERSVIKNAASVLSRRNPVPTLKLDVSLETSQETSKDHLEANLTAKLLRLLGPCPSTQGPHWDRVRKFLDFGQTFGEEERFIKIAASKKAELLESLVHEYCPGYVLEFGSYIGWSAQHFLLSMERSGKDGVVCCIEVDPLNYCCLLSLSKSTGTADRICGYAARSSDVIPLLPDLLGKKDPRWGAPDLIFFDHRGTLYGHDLRALELAGFIRKGVVVVSDNVLSPGAPQLLHHLCRNPNYRTRVFEVTEAFQASPDWVVVAECIAGDFTWQGDPARRDLFERVGRRVDAVSWLSQIRGRAFTADDWCAHAGKMRRFFFKNGIDFEISSFGI